LGTAELSTGLQISGIFTNDIEYGGKPIYIQTSGKTALAYREKEIVNHGTDYHSEGFGSQIGRLKNINLAIEDMSPRDLQAYNIYEGKHTELEFEGDIKVSGEIITGSRNLRGEIILISFKNCTVTHNDTVLFQPEWGIYDMAVGKKIVSAFSGPADVNSFDMMTHVPSTKTIKAKKTTQREALEQLYDRIRKYREQQTEENLNVLFNELITNHPQDWLLPLEMVELTQKENNPLYNNALKHLLTVKEQRPEIAHLITNGLNLLQIK